MPKIPSHARKLIIIIHKGGSIPSRGFSSNYKHIYKLIHSRNGLILIAVIIIRSLWHNCPGTCSKGGATIST